MQSTFRCDPPAEARSPGARWFTRSTGNACQCQCSSPSAPLRPGDEKTDITKHATGEVENSGSQTEAAWLQGIVPEAQEDLGAGGQCLLPARKASVDPATAVRAEIGGEGDQRHLPLAALKGGFDRCQSVSTVGISQCAG